MPIPLVVTIRYEKGQRVTSYDTFNMTTSHQQWVWEREARIEWSMSRLTREGTPEPVSRDQILRRRERGKGSIYFACSADYKQQTVYS